MKRGIFILILFISLFLIVGVVAQAADPSGSGNPDVSDVPDSGDEAEEVGDSDDPVEKVTEKLPGDLLEVNPETGSIKTFEDFQKFGEPLVKSQQNRSYLLKEWTKLAAKNKVIGPVLFYTDKFFSFFDPLWKYTFGMEFNWSLAFFAHMFFWGVIIYMVYFPAKEIMKNGLFGLIAAIIVASITGGFGFITKAVGYLIAIEILWKIGLIVIIIILLIVIYVKWFKGDVKKSRKEKLERAEDSTIAHGEVAQRSLEG